MRILTQISLILLLVPCAHFGQVPEKLNILFIAVDDLKPVMGCYGDTLVHTPHMDAIASKGITFTKNYCQQAITGHRNTIKIERLEPGFYWIRLQTARKIWVHGFTKN